MDNKISLEKIFKNLIKEKEDIEILGKILKKSKFKKIKKTFENEDKYIVYIFIDERLKDKYKKQLFKKSLDSIQQKLNIRKESIIILYFEDIKDIFPDIYKIQETPITIFFEKKINDNGIEIKYIWHETGYLI